MECALLQNKFWNICLLYEKLRCRHLCLSTIWRVMCQKIKVKSQVSAAGHASHLQVIASILSDHANIYCQPDEASTFWLSVNRQISCACCTNLDQLHLITRFRYPQSNVVMEYVCLNHVTQFLFGPMQTYLQWQMTRNGKCEKFWIFI